MNQTLPRILSLRLFAVGLFLCGVFAVYYPTVQSLLVRWNQTGSEYGHGPLLVLVILWLLFRQRQHLLAAPKKPCFLAFVPAILCSLLWSAGYVTQVNIVQQVALPGVIFFSITAVMGIAVARIVWFPLALIVLALPLWNVLQPPLQHLAVSVCSEFFSLLSIPAYIHDSSISLTSGTFQIAAGCAGLNLFLAATLLGLLYAHLNIASLQHQAIVVALAVAVGIVCNWVRISTIILIAQISDNIQHPIVQDHGWVGWVWFAVLFGFYLLLVNRLPFKARNEHHLDIRQNDINSQPCAEKISLRALLLCVFGVYSAPLFSVYMQTAQADQSRIFATPVNVAGYITQPAADVAAWRPNFQYASKELHLCLVDETSALSLHLYLYAAQTQGAELIHDDNTLADSQLWREVRRSNNTNSTSDVVLQSEDKYEKRLLVRYWYNVAGTNTTSAIHAKILQLKGMLSNRPEAALVAIATECKSDDCSAAQHLLNKVTHDVIRDTALIIANGREQRSSGI